jgi:ribonuclease HII
VSAPAPGIGAVRDALRAASIEALPELIAAHEADPRAGVRDAIGVARRRIAAHEAEIARLDALRSREDALRASGCVVVAGIDEVGRGSLAGPLTVAAVVLPAGARVIGLDDSKAIPHHRRRSVAEGVHAVAVAVSIVHLEPGELDGLGMTAALHTAMCRALAGLPTPADHALVDGNQAALPVPHTAVVKGDASVACIAAASCVAKVARDDLMVAYDVEHPGYGFAINKGYGTAEHMAALEALGPCAIHRRSFAPVGQRPLF